MASHDEFGLDNARNELSLTKGTLDNPAKTDPARPSANNVRKEHEDYQGRICRCQDRHQKGSPPVRFSILACG
jgi:hypothetical protein